MQFWKYTAAETGNNKQTADSHYRHQGGFTRHNGLTVQGRQVNIRRSVAEPEPKQIVIIVSEWANDRYLFIRLSLITPIC